MSERTPHSLWERLMRAIDDDREEVDEGAIWFHLLFIVPIFLVVVMLIRR